MAAEHSSVEPEATQTPTTSWRDLAVARSVDPARVRAEKRVQRFLDAALELMSGESGKDFTVQEVVKKSGQSLRSFYQYFTGKHELLLALFEESVHSTARRLQEEIADEDDALERLRRFTVAHYLLCRPLPDDSSERKTVILGMAEFAQQLLTEHPKEAARAFAPMFALLHGLLDEAAAQGAIRSGLDHRAIAGTLLQAIMFNSFAVTISGSPVRADGSDAEALWDLVLHGLAAGQPKRKRSAR
ncbi:TetR/AcrR family transcriptional regulator [Streptomyces sp. NPDC002896]|uniref:TetR/AcrR family transcriptional regulator n=1 Tax=Streptomyces sp. NPDC002896 TaxID=3154438 RepID=UPI003329FE52